MIITKVKIVVTCGGQIGARLKGGYLRKWHNLFLHIGVKFSGICCITFSNLFK